MLKIKLFVFVTFAALAVLSVLAFIKTRNASDHPRRDEPRKSKRPE